MVHDGSGGTGIRETTVITHRVQYLTKEYGIDPGDILVITFTRAAARRCGSDMKH